MKRKPSPEAMLSYLAGAAIMLFAIGISFATNKFEASLIGIIGLNLLWILGVQRDLYGEDAARNSG